MRPETRGYIRTKATGGLWLYPSGNGNTALHPGTLPGVFTHQQWSDEGRYSEEVRTGTEFVPIETSPVQEARVKEDNLGAYRAWEAEFDAQVLKAVSHTGRFSGGKSLQSIPKSVAEHQRQVNKALAHGLNYDPPSIRLTYKEQPPKELSLGLDEYQVAPPGTVVDTWVIDHFRDTTVERTLLLCPV